MKTRKQYRKVAHLVPGVVQMRSEGRTMDEIGKDLNITRQRVHQIIKSAKQMEGILSLWGFPLSVRTFNTLERLAIKSRQQALDLYNTGHLRPGAVRGFGWVSYHEICEWLGVPSIRQIVTRAACPHCGHLI